MNRSSSKALALTKNQAIEAYQALPNVEIMGFDELGLLWQTIDVDSGLIRGMILLRIRRLCDDPESDYLDGRRGDERYGRHLRSSQIIWDDPDSLEYKASVERFRTYMNIAQLVERLAPDGDPVGKRLLYYRNEIGLTNLYSLYSASDAQLYGVIQLVEEKVRKGGRVKITGAEVKTLLAPPKPEPPKTEKPTFASKKFDDREETPDDYNPTEEEAAAEARAKHPEGQPHKSVLVDIVALI